MTDRSAAFSMNVSKQVLIAGAWHLGSVMAGHLSTLGHHVYLTDEDTRLATLWQSSGLPPVREPGLDALCEGTWGQNLNWLSSNNTSTSWDWFVLAIDTPVTDEDQVDLRGVLNAFELALEHQIRDKTHILICSQLPVGTARQLYNDLTARHPNWHGLFVVQPENLRLGDALNALKSTDRVVLGITENSDEALCTQAYHQLMQLEHIPVQVMSLESAEMVKHALNAFLGTCIVFANEISDICEQVGANAWDVVSSLKKDARVGSKAFLRPGLGFAGGTLARDVKILSEHKTTPSTDFFGHIYTLNQHRHLWILNHLTKKLKTLTDKKIVMLGLTYKVNSSTLRRSPAIEIAQLLKQQHAVVVAIDTHADFTELSELEQAALPFERAEGFEAFDQADAVILVTEWPEFAEYPWTDLIKQMRTALIIDTKNHLSCLDTLPNVNRIIPGVTHDR